MLLRLALRLVQRMKEARRCHENRRLGRDWETEAGLRLVWRLQEPWARLRLERQRLLREAGETETRRLRLTPRLQSTVTCSRGEEEITINSSRKQINVARWGKFLQIRSNIHNINTQHAQHYLGKAADRDLQ